MFGRVLAAGDSMSMTPMLWAVEAAAPRFALISILRSSLEYFAEGRRFDTSADAWHWCFNLGHDFHSVPVLAYQETQNSLGHVLTSLCLHVCECTMQSKIS